MKHKTGSLASHAAHQKLVDEASTLLLEGKLVNEKDLGVDRQSIKTIMMSVKKKHSLDVLTISRGRQTMGWMLASEIIKQ